VGLVLALEGVLRAAGWHERTTYFQFRDALTPTGAATRHVVHPERFYTVAPDHRHSAEHAGRFATGREPWRGREAEPAPPWMLRVVVLGDSCAYGYGLAPAHTLSARLAEALAPLGYPPSRVQVLNRGVSGYSSVQITLAAREALAELEPDVVVLYPAAWNDQYPAMLLPDEALLAEQLAPSLAGRIRETAIAQAMEALVGSRRELELPLSREEVLSRWEEGDPPFGTRVARDRVAHHVRASIDAIRAAGAAPVVIVPPHPEGSRPACLADADSVRAAAEGVASVDGAALFAAVGDTSRLFLDFVHPSPPGVDLLAGALAPLVASALPAASTADGVLSVRDVSPARVGALGDELVSVTLAGWSAGDPLPSITVGGAPLLELEATGDSTVTGRTMGNVEGALALVAQTADGAAVWSERVNSLLPAPEWVPDAPPRVRVRARPGDAALVLFAAAVRDTPVWRLQGAFHLDEAQLLADSVRVEVGPGGVGEAPVPASVAAAPVLFAQPLVLPAGEPDDSSAARFGAATPLLP
jgi:lysophospholipase L1-like esterase